MIRVAMKKGYYEFEFFTVHYIYKSNQSNGDSVILLYLFSLIIGASLKNWLNINSFLIKSAFSFISSNIAINVSQSKYKTLVRFS